MQLKIEQDANFKEKVPYKMIHGKFPYKAYLEIKGNSKYGRYIVVVSDKTLGDIDSIAIKINGTNKTNMEVGPDIINKDFLQYRVKEVDIFTIEETPLFVFKPFYRKGLLDE